MSEVCNHKRHAHQICRDIAFKPEPLEKDKDGVIVGCVNCLKASTLGKQEIKTEVKTQ